MPDPLSRKKTPPWWVRYRVLLYLALGLLALDALVARCYRVWQAYSPDDYAERVENCRRQAPDLVVIGGSPVSEGVDPALLAGLRWHGHVVVHPYNLGLPGATTLEVWHAVEHGLASAPRLLVYGITASDLNDARMEPHGPASLMDVGDLLRLACIRPREAFWCLRHFGRAQAARTWKLLHYRHGIQLWTADRLETMWPGLCPELAAEGRAAQNYSAAMHRPDGFAPKPDCQKRRLDQLKAGSSAEFYFHFLDNYRVGGHLAYLHLLLDWSAAHDVAVVLVDMPVSADLEERLHSQEYTIYRQALAQLERERNVPVLRASRTSLGLTDADFADLVHMNARGTARFSAWLRVALEDKAYPQGPGKVYLHHGHDK